MGCLRTCTFLGGVSALLLAVIIGTLRIKNPRKYVSDACDNPISPGALKSGVRPFKCGWQELRSGVHAFIQPNGSWCWSNAGLIAQSGLLVDTLTDPALTRAMLKSAPAGPILAVVYTHPDIDHVTGDQEIPAAVPRHGHVKVQSEISLLPKQSKPLVIGVTVAHYLWGAAQTIGWQWMRQTPLWPFARKILGWAHIQARMSVFSFHELDATKVVGVTEPFDAPKINLKGADIYHFGSIHSKSDSVLLVESSKICFTGDLLFIGIAPVMWAGPAKAWVAALDRILELTNDDWLFVPGHGPVTDSGGVQFMRRYFEYVDSAVASCPAEEDDGKCAQRVLEGLPQDLWTEEPQRILISARVERMAQREGKSASIDLATKVSFLTEQGERLLGL